MSEKKTRNTYLMVYVVKDDIGYGDGDNTDDDVDDDDDDVDNGCDGSQGIA